MPLSTTIDILDVNKVQRTVGTLPAQGPATSDKAVPVVLATDQVLPLPTGAATAAKQDTANTALGSLDLKIPSKGAAAATGSMPVVLATDTTLPLPAGAATAAKQDNLIASLGALSDNAASSDTGTFSLLSFIKRGLANWTTLLARTPSLVGGRVPVDGSGVVQPIAAQLTYTAAGITLSNGQTTGFQASADGSLKVSGAVSASLAGVYSATPPSLSNGQTSPFQLGPDGSLKVSGVVSVTNVNGDGQTNMAGSAPVVIASDQSPVPEAPFKPVATSTKGPFPTSTTNAAAAIALSVGQQYRVVAKGADVRIALGSNNTIAVTTPTPGTLTSGVYAAPTAGSRLIVAGSVEVFTAESACTHIAFKTDTGTGTIEFTPGSGA